MGGELKDIAAGENAVIIGKAGGGKAAIPVTDSGDMLINYAGSVQDIPRFSFVELLKEGELWMSKNTAPAKLKSLKGKAVVIGTTALGLEDRRVTPFHKFEPATSIQAQAITTIVEGKFLKELPRGYSLLIFLAMGIAIILYGSASGRSARSWSPPSSSRPIWRALTPPFSIIIGLKSPTPLSTSQSSLSCLSRCATC
jgi:CHASE2 domain-containing sensor protein